MPPLQLFLLSFLGFILHSLFSLSLSLSLSLSVSSRAVKNLSSLSAHRAGVCVGGGEVRFVSPARGKDFPLPKRGHQVLTLRDTTSTHTLPGKVQTDPQPRASTSHALPARPPRGVPRDSLPNTCESSERLPPFAYDPPSLVPNAHNKGGQDYCFMIILFNLSYDQH